MALGYKMSSTQAQVTEYLTLLIRGKGGLVFMTQSNFAASGDPITDTYRVSQKKGGLANAAVFPLLLS